MSLSVGLRSAGDAATRRFSVITEHLSGVPAIVKSSSFVTEVRLIWLQL